jgi:excisionase family DNA binding protein
MAKCHLTIGETMKYISVNEAAALLGVTKQAVFQAIWRRTFKAIKHGKRTFTTVEWANEFKEHWHSKQEHSMFNGEKVYSQEKGHMSVRMVANAVGVKEQMIYDMIKEGKLKALKKGCHIVICQEEFDKMREAIYARHCKSA